MSTAASYNTIQLEATPLNPFGKALADVGTPTFTSPDHERLLVSPTGELTAVGSTNGELVPVVATLVVRNVRHSDTAYVRIDDNQAPPVLASFSIQLTSPVDSAKIPLSGGMPIFPAPNVRALDPNGDPIPNLPVSLLSSDVKTLRLFKPEDVGPGRFLLGEIPGRTATLYASTTAYGVMKTDSLLYRVGWPVSGFVAVLFHNDAPPNFGYYPSEKSITKIGVGGVVRWDVSGMPPSSDPLDITFDDADLPNVAPAAAWGALDYAASSLAKITNSPVPPSLYFDFYLCSSGDDCGNGNIIGLSSNGRAARVFLAPGTYKYRSIRYGISGQVVVIDERQ